MRFYAVNVLRHRRGTGAARPQNVRCIVENLEYWIFGGAVIAVGLIAIAAIKYCILYASDVRYVKMEISRSCSKKETEKWKRELRALRWSMLPGVTPDKVLRFYKKRKSPKYLK